MPRSEEQPGGTGEVADPPAVGTQGKDGGPRPGEPRSPRPYLGALPLLLCSSSQLGGSRRSPDLSRGDRAQPAEGRADAAGRDAGSEDASAWDGGERFAAASSETPNPDVRRSPLGADWFLELP